MSLEIEIDLKSLIGTLNVTEDKARNGAIQGMQDVLNTWQLEARDDAPIEYGELRRQIKQKLEVGKGLDINAQLSNNVYKDGFNYAYWQHNVRGNGGLKYIEKPMERNKEKWKFHIENEIRKSVGKAGW